MVFQQFNLVDRLSVVTNVLTGRLAHRSWVGSVFYLFRQEDLGIAREALSRVGLTDKAWNRADKLSGGQQQRDGIARATLRCPARRPGGARRAGRRPRPALRRRPHAARPRGRDRRAARRSGRRAGLARTGASRSARAPAAPSAAVAPSAQSGPRTPAHRPRSTLPTTCRPRGASLAGGSTPLARFRRARARLTLCPFTVCPLPRAISGSARVACALCRSYAAAQRHATHTSSDD